MAEPQDKRRTVSRPPVKAQVEEIAPENRVNTITPSDWEDYLAALVTHQTDTTPLEELNTDPAIQLIRELIQSFRASMVSESFRYTARLLMISLEWKNTKNYWLDSGRKKPRNHLRRQKEQTL